MAFKKWQAGGRVILSDGYKISNLQRESENSIYMSSFWLDDIAGDDAPHSQNICPNCTGTTFYDDPITNIPTCASCFTQSQTATQEEFGEDDAYALAGGGMHHR
eukprot:scaffold9076_cov101-Skeletonema_dohrnii-CCMP3373.AAC.2